MSQEDLKIGQLIDQGRFIKNIGDAASFYSHSRFFKNLDAVRSRDVRYFSFETPETLLSRLESKNVEVTKGGRCVIKEYDPDYDGIVYLTYNRFEAAYQIYPIVQEYTVFKNESIYHDDLKILWIQEVRELPGQLFFPKEIDKDK